MKILFIGAHFDDIEIGCGGTVARLHSKRHDVEAVVVTHSGYNDEKGREIRSAATARAEGIKGLNTLGVVKIHELNMNTGNVAYDLKLIHLLEETVKLVNPALVFTHWDNDVHQDHSAIGRATLNVCRKNRSVLMYRSNWYRSSVQFSPRVFVDTSSFFEKKKEAINCHVSEVGKFGSGWMRFIESQDISVGMEFGYNYAEAFEAIKIDLFCGTEVL